MRWGGVGAGARGGPRHRCSQLEQQHVVAASYQDVRRFAKLPVAAQRPDWQVSVVTEVRVSDRCYRPISVGTSPKNGPGCERRGVNVQLFLLGIRNY